MNEIVVMESLHHALHGSAFLTNCVKYITMLGDKGLIWIILGAIMLCFRKTRVQGLVMLCALALGIVLNDFIIKNIFARSRPFVQSGELYSWLSSTGYKFPTGYSFPSGHSMAGFACAVVLLFFYKKRALPALSVAILISLSRAYMCVHFISDVACGALLGILVGLLIVAYYKMLWPDIERGLYKLKMKIVKKNKENEIKK